MNAQQTLTGYLILFGVLFLIGCGGGDAGWPSSQGDYASVAADRGLAMMWGVKIDVEKTGGEEVTVAVTGSLGETPEDANAQSEMKIGDVSIRFETNGTKHLKLFVNETAYGLVLKGQRLKITDDRRVFVNDKERK